MKIIRWEFWPYWLFYIPVYVKYLYLGVKARSFVFFSAANPGMLMGGFSSYSKFEVLDRLSSAYKPKTFLVGPDEDKIKEILNSNGIDFPFILKPDVGERGFGVAKIDNEAELKIYLSKADPVLVLQEYVNYPLEIGVMYHRIPGEAKGKISSVVIKEFLSTTGDGKSTLSELFRKGERSKLYIDLLEKRFRHRLDEILPKGKHLELESIGNHCRGTKFLNGNHLINNELLDVFDKISHNIGNHFFGRYDLRVASLEELYKGETIRIMEVNGANSEPAHIYDPSMKLIAAYRSLFEHWQNLYDVSIVNHRKGIDYMPLGKAIRLLRSHIKHRNS